MTTSMLGINVYLLISICFMGFNYINFYPINYELSGRLFSLIYSLPLVLITLKSTQSFLNLEETNDTKKLP